MKKASILFISFFTIIAVLFNNVHCLAKEEPEINLETGSIKAPFSSKEDWKTYIKEKTTITQSGDGSVNDKCYIKRSEW